MNSRGLNIEQVGCELKLSPERADNASMVGTL
jgi:hypothetical protein